LSDIKEEKLQIYFSSEFYLSHDILEHHITSETILNILASIGGLHRILKLLFNFILGKFNKKVLSSKFIRNMYFLKKEKGGDNNSADNFSSSLKRMETSFFTQDLMTIHTKAYHTCWKYYKLKSQPKIDQT
jgi:hypothetical protein